MTEMNATTADAVVVLTEAAVATDTATAAVVEMTAAEDDLTMAIMAKITELDAERAALHLSERELFILNATKLKGVELSYEQSAGIRDAAAALYDEREEMKESERAQKALDDTRAKSIEVWTKLSTRGAEQRAEAEIEANRRTQENTQRTHEFITNSLLGIGEKGGNVFKQIGDSFEAMVKRMVAEWAASKLMSLFGLGGTGAANPFAAIGSAVTNAIGGSAAGAAGGGGVAAAIGGGVKAVGSAVSGGLSSAGAAIAANPLLAGVGVAALAAAALAEKPTYSSNAGMLIHDAPGASADRKFSVSPFASGFSPVGFARREDQGAATAVIDVFRSYDASLTEIARAAGLKVNFNNNPFGGFDERGQGNGLFLGTAAEQGSGVTSASMSDQLTQFSKQWVEALGGQVSAADREFLLSSASADQLLERAATLGQAEAGRINGSLFGGLARVPFNGYRAELHKGEEVLRANDPRNQNNGNGMVGEMRDMLAEMRNMAFYTKRTADLLLRVTRDGDSLVTVAA